MPRHDDLTVWSYGRVSVAKDADDSKNLSVDSQLSANRATAERMGWTLAGESKDVGISASKYAKGKDRPGFREALAAVERGDANAILVWELSRLSRDEVPTAMLMDHASEHGAYICDGAKVYDPSDPDDRYILGIMFLGTSRESGQISKRTARSLGAIAESGGVHGKVPFGYRREYDATTGKLLRQVEDETEGLIVRELAKRFLSGETLGALCRDLNKRGIRTKQSGAEWTNKNLSQLLANPSYAGIRYHKGRRIDAEAQWPALLTETDHLTITGILSDPSRRTQKDSQAKHLLSGIALCGKCNRPLRAAKNNGGISYSCSEYCLTRRKDAVDKVVTESVILRLSMPDALGLIAADGGTAHIEAAQEAVALRAQLSETEEAIVNGDLSPVAGGRIVAKVESKLADAEARAIPPRTSPAVASLLGTDDVAKAWENLSVAQRREVVKTLTTVTIEPSGRGRRTFNPDLIRIEWRDNN